MGMQGGGGNPYPNMSPYGPGQGPASQAPQGWSGQNLNGYQGGGSPQGNWQPQNNTQPQGNGPPMGGNYGNQWNPQNGAGGYNPQPMNGSTYSPGPPNWDMRLGAGGVDYMTAGASRSTPGTPDWLKLQLGQNEDQPYAVDPNRYGRWNWGTNLQGGGIPSPFGQYAQQYAQYPQLQFPPPPTGGGGGGPGQPPPPGPGTPPPPGNPPPGGGGNNWIIPGYGQQAVQAAARAGQNSAQDLALQKAISGAGLNYNQTMNSFQEGGGQYDPSKDSRFLTDPNANMSAYGLQWNGNQWTKPGAASDPNVGMDYQKLGTYQYYQAHPDQLAAGKPAWYDSFAASLGKK